jgi:polysaccharide export outer membrane protein
MNFLRYTLYSICLVSAIGVAVAQTIGKPVLTPAPAAAPPSTPAAPPAANEPATVDKNSYIIGPDDSLKIDVYGSPDLSTALPVRPDGMITLPEIGDIPAAGRTPMQLTADIAAQVKKLVVDPTVTVTVMAVNSKHVFLIGEIGHQGPLSITPGMTILQAISAAGGLTPYANKKHIYILRGDPGKQQKIPFDYTKALKKGDMQGVTLQPGDTIVVPS